MDKSTPNLAIRQALFEALDGIVVNGETILCYDTRVSGVEQPDYYILMSSQSNEVDKANKCEWYWDSTILLDIVTIYGGMGNPGDRELSNAIQDEVRELTKDLVLDGFDIITTTQSFPDDLFLETDSENIFRSFVRLNLLIK